MGRVERTREIARRRSRRIKLAKIRKKFAQASTDAEKQALQEKAARISQFVVLGEK
ncbi:MAG: hypothetical protein KDA65_04660 [Planctomycetaceae bacterium]|nr:hypothetical protein [Planctomycetaceae bacterium]